MFAIATQIVAGRWHLAKGKLQLAARIGYRESANDVAPSRYLPPTRFASDR